MIEFRNVSFRYERSRGFAVKDISLEFKVRRIYGVIGPNGSGKSTLLRMMNGLIPHFYRGEMVGRVLVDGMLFGFNLKAFCRSISLLIWASKERLV